MPYERERQPAPELDRELAVAYAATFIPRFDQYPLQLKDGTYVAIKQTLHPDLIVAHLKGIITIGAYALSPDHTAHWICLDADTGEQWDKLQHVSASLAKRDVPSYVEPSRDVRQQVVLPHFESKSQIIEFIFPFQGDGRVDFGVGCFPEPKRQLFDRLFGQSLAQPFEQDFAHAFAHMSRFLSNSLSILDSRLVCFGR